MTLEFPQHKLPIQGYCCLCGDPVWSSDDYGYTDDDLLLHDRCVDGYDTKNLLFPEDEKGD